MATPKQRELAKKIVENYGNDIKKPEGQLIKESGYSEVSAKNPKSIIEGRGVQSELAKYGLTEELYTSALVEDIQAKPGNRARELELARKSLKIGEKEEKGDTNVTFNILNYSPNDNDSPQV